MEQTLSLTSVIDKLKDADISGEGMEYIIREVNLEQQILRQLFLKASDQQITDLTSERESLHIEERARLEPTLAYRASRATTTYEVDYCGSRYYVEHTIHDDKEDEWSVTDTHDTEVLDRTRPVLINYILTQVLKSH